MTDAANVLSILDYVTAAGEPVSGGSIEFYQAGTSTARTVYSDAALTVSLGTIVYTDSEGFPVSTQGGTTRISIYTGTGAYKVVVKNSSGTTLFTRDNIPGALDTSGFTTTSALPTVPVSVKTAAYTITTSDRGYLFNANPTGGTFVMTLPSAVTAGANFTVGVRHNGTANQVTLATVASQYIRGPGTPTSYFSLVGRGEEVWLVSDGADWIVSSYTPAFIRPGHLPPPLHITDRLTAPPSSPTAGARYIVNGTATGAWSTLGFAQHDIAEADGNGSWIKYTPNDGWVAYVADEAVLTQFRGSAWVDLSNVTAPQTSALETMELKYDGTGTNGLTQSAWTTVPLTTETENSITNGSFSAPNFTLPAGDYIVIAQASFLIPQSSGASTGRCRIYSVTAAAERLISINQTTSNVASQNVGLAPLICSRLTLTGTEQLRLEAWTSTSGVNLGSPDTSSSGEKFAYVTVINLSSMQGPAGAQGAQGTDGLDAAYPYQWSTSTSGDPGSGKIAGNNATIASITQIAISETDSAGGSMGAVIATWDDSTSSVRALVKISREGATQNFHAFRISGAGTDQGSYWTFPVTYVATSGTISNGTNCAVLVIEKGDKGDTGATGATGAAGPTGATGPNTGLDYAWATATSGDPGSGKILANNATLASATAIHISKTGRNAESLGSVIATWDDSTNTTHYGHLRVFTVADRTEYIEAEVTGLTDNGTYYTVAVTVTSANGTPSANDGMAVMFERTGNAGASSAAGSSGQIQYNNAGNLGGGAGTTWDNANQRLRIDGASAAATYGTLTLSKTGGASSVLDLENDYSGKALRVLGPPDIAGRNPVTYIGNGGEISTRAWLRVSGHTSGTGDGYEHSDPIDSGVYPQMVCIWADVAWALMVRTYNASGGYLFGGLDRNANFRFVIPEAGNIQWGPSTASTPAGLDTGLSRTAAAVLAVGNGTDGDVSGKLRLAEIRFGSGANGDLGLYRASAGVLNVDGATQGDAGGTVQAAAHAISSGAAGYWNNTGLRLAASSSAIVGWHATNATAGQDVALSRAAAGVIGVGTGTAGAVDGAVAAASYRFQATSPDVAFLRAGAGIIYVTDSGLANANGALYGANLGIGNAGGNGKWGATTLELRSDAEIRFSASTAATGTKDVGLYRNAAGVIGVHDGATTTNYRDVKLRNLETTGSIELGAASDTTLARASAGVMSVEGKTVATLSTSQAWTAHQYVTLGTLTDGANIAWDVSTAQKAKVTLGGNRTMNAVSNAVEGATYTLWVIQDGTGSRTITWTTSGAGSFDFGTDGSPTLTTTASKADLLAFEAISIGGTLKLRYMGIKKGFT